MGKVDTKELLDTGETLAEQRAEIVQQQGANRTLLRNLSAAGHLSDAEEDRLAEIYPERQRAEGEFESDEEVAE